MRRRAFLQTVAGAPLVWAQRPAAKPNIIVVLADDIGYGDLSCYGATRVRTPNVDRLAARGVRFADGHSSSATCTPTRYSMLTGEYAWRKPGTSILPGDANLIIDPGRLTLASMLKQAGYRTAVVGKWHLGLGRGPIDWNGLISPGPNQTGFDYSFIIPATGDRVPCVYVENGRVAGLDPKDPISVSYREKIGDEPTGKERPDLLTMKLTRGHDMTIVNGISRIGWMTGGRAARWKDAEMARDITRRAVSFIEQNRRGPFFLYFATHDIHVPRVAHPDFRGTTQCGTRCDVIAQFDWSIGQLVASLERTRQLENTLILITSDNGPVLDDGYADGAVEDLNGHMPAGPLRGGKYSMYEAGTRVPFIVNWPARIKPGVSKALVSQVDLVASFAALTGQKLAEGDAPDSENVLPALLGESPHGRDTLVEHGPKLALRKKNWKLIPGENLLNPKAAAVADELYDLDSDLSETNNLAAEQPARLAAMKAELRALYERPRR